MRIRGQVLSKHSIDAHYCHNYSQIQSHRLSGEISRRQRGGEHIIVLVSGVLEVGSEGQAGGLGSGHYSRLQEGVSMF